MPLSEDEQRILSEIEHQLRASDPALVREVGETTVFSAPLRRTRLAVVGLVLGLVVTVALLITVNAVVAFIVGFGLMFLSAYALERNIRHLGRMGVDHLADSLRGGRAMDYLGFGKVNEDDEGRDERGDGGSRRDDS